MPGKQQRLSILTAFWTFPRFSLIKLSGFSLHLVKRQTSPWTIGRSENQKNQKIKNGECFFCVLVYKEQGKLQLV